MGRNTSAGTAVETAVVKYLWANGFPQARREVKHGNKDCGDVLLCESPKVIVEVKGRRTTTSNAALGQPGPKELAKWMAETEAERANSKASCAVLVVKRAGTANPADWWCYLAVADLLYLVYESATRQLGPVVCLAFGDLVREMQWLSTQT